MECYVLGASRIPFVRSFTRYQDLKTQDLMEASLQSLVKKYRLQDQKIGDVALGAVMKSSRDWNLARECVLGSGLHATTPAYDTQRACGTSLENALQIQLKIHAGRIPSGIAGGVDSNSDLPFLFPRSFARKLMALQGSRTFFEKLRLGLNFRWRDFRPQIPAVVEARTQLSMGQHCELMVQEWGISREAQDRLAVQSHLNAEKAYQNGFYQDLVIEFQGVSKDSFVRGDSDIQKLGKLKPAFERGARGTLTAGNSSPLTDGSACVLLGTEVFAKSQGLEPWARLVDGEVAALDYTRGEGLLMAPSLAVARLLERQKLKLQEFDFYEIHEAFAGQVLCTLEAWKSPRYAQAHWNGSPLGEIDLGKLNVVGSSLALGHPFAATGARITGTLAKLLLQSKGTKPRRGLISICTAGGMGVAAILESC